MRSESDEFQKKENPREGANFLSALTFWYSFKLFSLGSKRDLDEDDLTRPLNEHKSSILGTKLAESWSKELDRAARRKTKPSLSRIIFKTFVFDVVFYGIMLFFMEIGVRLSQPVFIGLFVRYFTTENRNSKEPTQPPMWLTRVVYYWSKGQSPIAREEAYFFGGCIMMCSMLIIATFHPYVMATLHVGMKIRVACCSLLYRKALRIKLTSLGGKTVGNAVNLMSNDVMRFDQSPVFLHYLWLSPLQGVIMSYLIFLEIGVSAFYGMMAVGIVLPIQFFLGAKILKFRRISALRTDDRVRQMNEIIQAMQVIKMYAWENAFAGLISNLRKRELKILLLTSYIKGIAMSLIMFTARSGVFLSVLSYVLLGYEIKAEQVFLISSYYQIVRQTITVYFPQGINAIAETAVAIKRIEEFMMIEETVVGDPSVLDPFYETKLKLATMESFQELSPRRRRARSPNNMGKSISQLVIPGRPLGFGEFAEVTIVRGIAKYGEKLCLDNINMSIQPGQLIAIVGPVGAGKTCLLTLILRELKLFSGKLIVKGTVSYSSQEPWLFEGPVRQNILFGKPFEADRYREIIRVCALRRDFSLLPYSDRTIVGERGTSLSGGQRARVNLARAVYKKADIYLLDDPLSAVDIQVGQQLFEECLIGYLSDKIVILVTHQLQYLKRADKIIILSEGVIQFQGTYAEIKKSGLGFAVLLEEAAVMAAQSIEKEEKDVDRVLRALSITSEAFNSMIDIEGLKFLPKVTPEMRTLGSVDFANYKEYFLAGGNCCALLLMCMLFLGSQILANGGDYFLSIWVSLEELRGHFGTAEEMGLWDQLSRKHCIIIFSALMVATIVVTIVRSICFYTVCMRASFHLHNRMFESIIHAAMRFFHTNTSGRILNRFSKDLGAVDELLPNAFIDTTQLLLNLVGAIVVVCAVNVWLTIPVVVMVTSFFFLRRLYLKTSRSVKRLEGIARSPVFAHLNASLQGLTTIRSNNAEKILVEEFDYLQDVHSSAWYMFLYTSRAFSLWLDIICAVFIGVVTFSFLIFSDKFYGSEVGLSITQCIGLTGLIQWGMRQSAELENQMTAVERVLEFTRVEHEPDLYSEPDKKPPATWPKFGKIEFIGTCMRYNITELPVLTNLNILILPKEKVGIVGRTGAGKSSLIVTLFRLAYFEGEVLIDNLDISVLGLHDLRKKISIIPQEPTVFSGTLRYNLDPFDEFEDEDMVNALIDVEDKCALTKGAACLDNMMSEGGANVSLGQRQMICLARAILRNNKILVMDEATANVDAQTDKLIQKTIRAKFANCTVLTIAHRLHTVMDSDKILVMDAGQVVEFEHPYVLLQNKNGFFTDLVNKTGHGTAASLKKIAKQSFEARKAQIQNLAIQGKSQPGGSTESNPISEVSSTKSI